MRMLNFAIIQMKMSDNLKVNIEKATELITLAAKIRHKLFCYLNYLPVFTFVKNNMIIYFLWPLLLQIILFMTLSKFS